MAKKAERKTNNVVEFNKNKKNIPLVPKTENQEDYIYCLLDPSCDMVFGIGPAGSGKTMLATLWALKELIEGRVKKIVITRPNVAVDDSDIGYLPGDILEKMMPWVLPITDVMEEHISKQEVIDMIQSGKIEIVPFAYMRGRTFKNSAVIIDEAQGTTPNSMKAVLTRLGENSKYVITGDLEQTDRGVRNGLQDFLERFKNFETSDRIEVIHFEKKDIQRHPVVSEILKIYED